MLAGHYGVAFALRSRVTGVKLVWLVIAVQAVDIVFFLLALFGIETLVPVPTANGPLGMELAFIPYTHSAVLTIVYAVIVVAIGALLRQRIAGLVLAAALASHWLLDLFVHLQDLPITVSQQTKVGFGLWQHPPIAFALEIALLAAGIWLLWRQTTDSRARTWLVSTFVVLTIVQVIYVATPAQPTVLRMAIGAELIYLITALLAWRVDRLSKPPEATSSRPVSG